MKDLIRKETPLSITPIEAPIFEVLKDTSGVLFTNVVEGKAVLQGLQFIKAGTKLRLLRCSKGETGSAYQWGEGNDFVMLDNALTVFVSGNLGVAFDGNFELLS